MRKVQPLRLVMLPLKQHRQVRRRLRQITQHNRRQVQLRLQLKLHQRPQARQLLWLPIQPMQTTVPCNLTPVRHQRPPLKQAKRTALPNQPLQSLQVLKMQLVKRLQQLTQLQRLPHRQPTQQARQLLKRAKLPKLVI